MKRGNTEIFIFGKTSLQEESGATYVEYILATALLIMGLISANQYLSEAARKRSNQSADVVSQMAPCGDNLRANECY